jgi:hypothetical protein
MRLIQAGQLVRVGTGAAAGIVESAEEMGNREWLQDSMFDQLLQYACPDATAATAVVKGIT